MGAARFLHVPSPDGLFLPNIVGEILYLRMCESMYEASVSPVVLRPVSGIQLSLIWEALMYYVGLDVQPSTSPSACSRKAGRSVVAAECAPSPR